MKLSRTLSREEVLNYEAPNLFFARWITKGFLFDWLTAYMVWKVNRKYLKYQKFLYFKGEIRKRKNKSGNKFTK